MKTVWHPIGGVGRARDDAGPAPAPATAASLERLHLHPGARRGPVWATLHDPAAQDALFPELRLGPAAPSWPAAGATRSARLRLGLLVANVRLESLEARPSARFQLILVGDGIRLQRGWFLEEVAGGTRVAGTAGLTTIGALAGAPDRRRPGLGRPGWSRPTCGSSRRWPKAAGRRPSRAARRGRAVLIAARRSSSCC